MGKLSKLYRFFHKNLCVYFSTPWQVDLIAVLTFLWFNARRTFYGSQTDDSEPGQARG